MTMPRPRPGQFALALAVILLAALIRGYRLSGPALRGDEAFSVEFSAQPLAGQLAAMSQGEPNPPLYHVLLNGWMLALGKSEVAVRWPSVLAGGLTVALGYRVARGWLSFRAATLAATFIALNPFLIWYAQDARAYSLLTAFVLAAIWCTWLAANHGKARYWVAAGSLWWLALFTHYFAALPLVMSGLALLLSPRTRSRWRTAFITAVVTGLAFLPWALYIAPFMLGHTKGWISAPSAPEALWQTLETFSIGLTAEGWARSLGAVVLGLLSVLGLVSVARRDLNAALWLGALGWGVPVMLWLIALWRPVFVAQYAITAVPALLMLASAGIEWGRWPLGWRLATSGALIGVALIANGHYFFDPRFAKSPDMRVVMQYLQQTARPGEIILLNQPDPPFTYYARRAGLTTPRETAPPGPLAQVGEAATVSQLAALRDSYQHLRFFFAPQAEYDPNGFVNGWLEGCCELMGDERVAGLRVKTFDTPSGSLAARNPLTVDFENGLALTGYRFAQTQVAAGDSVHLTLFWTGDRPTVASYTVFVHVLAADGFQVAGADGLPRAGNRLTTHWTPGETIIDPHPIKLPADLPLGEYAVQIGWYERESGVRLLTSAGADSVRLPQTILVSVP